MRSLIWQIIILLTMSFLIGCTQPPATVEVTRVHTEYIEVTRVYTEYIDREVITMATSPLNYNDDYSAHHISYGQIRPGQLDARALRDIWTFEGATGDLIKIEMIGGTLNDPFLALKNSEEVVLASSDDNGFEINNLIFAPDGLDAHIEYMLEKDDLYTIVASSIYNCDDLNNCDQNDYDLYNCDPYDYDPYDCNPYYDPENFDQGTYILSLERTSSIVSNPESTTISFGEIVFGQLNSLAFYAGNWYFLADEGDLITVKVIGNIEETSNFAQSVHIYSRDGIESTQLNEPFIGYNFITLNYVLSECDVCNGEYYLEIADFQRPFSVCIEKENSIDITQVDVCEF